MVILIKPSNKELLNIFNQLFNISMNNHKRIKLMNNKKKKIIK